MTQMKWHEVIKHMAEHGFESVEYRPDDDAFWVPATSWRNPFEHPYLQWRIKPTTLKISVEIPKPDGTAETGFGLGPQGDVVWYSTFAKRNEVMRILVAALRGESS